MELAVITDEISQDLDHALDVMAEFGIYNAEIRGIWGVNIADADDAIVDKIKVSCRNHNAKVIGLATPVFKCDLSVISEDEGQASGALHGASVRGFDEQIAILRRCIEVARQLDARLIRVFTFWKKQSLSSKIEAAIVAAFQEPARLAEASGVTLIIENEHACFTGTGEETARIIAAVNSSAVQAVWDPGNAYMAGEQPFPAGYNYIKKYTAHVHVKDANVDLAWTVLGDGAIDWPGQLSALKNDGYDGYLSLETHYSGGGDPETSSRQCLVGLRRLLDNV